MSLHILSVTADLVDFWNQQTVPEALKLITCATSSSSLVSFINLCFWSLCVRRKSRLHPQLLCAGLPGHLPLCGAHDEDTLWSTASLQPWAGAEDQAAPVGDAPSLLETEQPDGRILITESFTNSRRCSSRVHMNVSEEPLPESSQCHMHHTAGPAYTVYSVHIVIE